MGEEDPLRSDLREIREGIAELSTKMSVVGNAIHEHLNQIEAPKEKPFWIRPLTALMWILVIGLALGILGWLAKEAYLPEGFLEKFLEAGLEKAKV